MSVVVGGLRRTRPATVKRNRTQTHKRESEKEKIAGPSTAAVLRNYDSSTIRDQATGNKLGRIRSAKERIGVEMAN